MAYRVVYGETIPVWEREFPTLREAKAFAKKHKSFGGVIFSIERAPYDASSTLYPAHHKASED